MYELSSGASIGTKDRWMSKQGGEMAPFGAVGRYWGLLGSAGHFWAPWVGFDPGF